MFDILKCYQDSETLATKLQLHCLTILRRDMSTKKTKPNNYRKMTRKPQSQVKITWITPVILNILGLVSVTVWYCERDFLIRH